MDSATASDLQTLIVIVLTSSSDSVDIEEAYRLGARSYLVKPLSVDARLEMAKALKQYWLGVNQMPHHCASTTLSMPESPARELRG